MGMAWKERAALFTGLSMVHAVATLTVLNVQTSCFELPCFDSLFFDIPRGVAMFPLFHTPLADFPAQDATFWRAWSLFGGLLLNAALAVAFYWAAWVGARRGAAWWRSRR
jgi:hypothetical protein